MVPPHDGADERGRDLGRRRVEVHRGAPGAGFAQQPHQRRVEQCAGRDDGCDHASGDTRQEHVGRPQRVLVPARGRPRPVQEPDRCADRERDHAGSQLVRAAREDRVAVQPEEDAQRPGEQQAQTDGSRAEAQERPGEVVHASVRGRRRTPVDPPVRAPRTAPHQELGEPEPAVALEADDPGEGGAESGHRGDQRGERCRRDVEGPPEGARLVRVRGEPAPRPERHAREQRTAHHQERELACQPGFVTGDQDVALEHAAEQTGQPDGHHDEQAVEQEVLEHPPHGVAVSGPTTAVGAGAAYDEHDQDHDQHREQQPDEHVSPP